MIVAKPSRGQSITIVVLRRLSMRSDGVSTFCPSICFATISVLYLLKRQTSKTKHRSYILVLNGIIVTWGVCAAVTSLTFQCRRKQASMEPYDRILYIYGEHCMLCLSVGAKLICP